jgi:GNAT superfamily N-acetyltransferase
MKIIRKILRKTSSILRSINFIAVNLNVSKKFLSIPKYTKDNIVYQGAGKLKDIRDANNLYFSMNGGKSFGWKKNIIYRIAGNKLLFIARNNSNKEVVAIGLYYFNKRDICESSVHEGFTGVKEVFQRQGIGTAMRKHAIDHFFNSGLLAISSRVSLSNTYSLSSNQKLGFKPVEKYFDPIMNEERYYLLYEFVYNKKFRGNPK